MANTFKGKGKFILNLGQLKTEVIEEIVKAEGANAKEFAALARRNAPVDEGDLRESTVVERVQRTKNVVVHRVVSGNDKAYYARWVEFLIQAYFFPSYRALKRRFQRRYSYAFRKARKRIFK